LQDRQLKKTRNGVWFVIESAAISLKMDYAIKADKVAHAWTDSHFSL